MLPQPNFGPSPDRNADDEPEGPPKKVGRLRIALWVQTVFAVLAGNILVFNLMALRSAEYDELVDMLRESAPEGEQVPKADAEAAADLYHGSTFLAVMIGLAVLLILSAVFSALCAVRLKTRMKAVRRLAIAASIVLLLLSMFSTLFFPSMFLLLMIWVFASILAIWWLMSTDVRFWMSESKPA